MADALISIKPEYVTKLVTGKKTVELRRRRPNFKVGTRLWIYSTLPEGTLRAFGKVVEVKSGSPSAIWRKYNEETGISYNQYVNYVSGCNQVFVIKLKEVSELNNPPSFRDLKNRLKNFHPPQFFMWIPKHSQAFRYLNSLLKT